MKSGRVEFLTGFDSSNAVRLVTFRNILTGFNTMSEEERSAGLMCIQQNIYICCFGLVLYVLIQNICDVRIYRK